MKTLLLTCVILCLHFLTSAQRYYGQWTLSGEAAYGNTGYSFGITGEKYLGRSLSGIKMNISFSRQRHQILDWKFPFNRYLLNLSYFYSLERYMSEYIFINVGSGFFLGAENIGQRNLPFGVVQKKKTVFVTGLFIAPQIEFLFRRGSSLSGFIEPTIAYDFYSRLNNVFYSGKLGVKYYF